MMQRYPLYAIMACILCGSVFLLGCSRDICFRQIKDNMPPEVWLSSGPVEGDTTCYQVHFYWGGWDPDGEVACFEFKVVDNKPFGFGFDEADTAGVWPRTTARDSVFKVTADTSPDSVEYERWYTRYERTHTFFIRAVDMEGMRSIPAHRSFTAVTLAPYIYIDRPPPDPAGGIQSFSTIVTFGWVGNDPIDIPANTQEPESVRYLWSQVVDTSGEYKPEFNIIKDLNENPWRYEDRWSPWIHYRAPEDSGRMTVLGDDEILEVNHSHIFAVQAKDEAGAVTAIFESNRNVRQFLVSETAGPVLTVTEPYLGRFRFLGTKVPPKKIELPPAIPLNFVWRADASHYGGEIECYRYGWDVEDLGDPDDWDVMCTPYNTAAPESKILSGFHTIYIEAVDDGGAVTLGRILIEVIPFGMERNLLWVDDFYSVYKDIPDYSHPSESAHDDFWLDICSRASGFDSERDVFDCYYDNNRRPPEIRDIANYKNIIWTYSRSECVWSDVICFTPESMIGTGCIRSMPNYLPIFLAKGGHLWTLGRSDRLGGLATIFLSPLFPVSIKCEIAGNVESGCGADTSGVRSMAYKDYCVSVLDKIDASFRIDRRIDRDGMKFAYRDGEDGITALYPELPDTLNLWREVINCSAVPRRYFCPQVRGFSYVEIYDPRYWLDEMGTVSQPCFHPMYRMRARSTLSPVDRTAVAIWVTKYSHIVPDAGSGAAAKSVHFGLPLWFFDRQAVNQIVDVVFSEWQILESR